MQLKTKGYYATRSGKVVQIVGENPLPSLYPFYDEKGVQYTCTGRADLESEKHPDDLVAEGIEIEVGASKLLYLLFNTEEVGASPNNIGNIPQGQRQTMPMPSPFTVDGYELLADVLTRAYEQASAGKGKERHAAGDTPFEEQPMTLINLMLGSTDGFLFQAHKKSLESKRLPLGRAQAELLGAINYLAGAVIALDHKQAMENFNAG